MSVPAYVLIIEDDEDIRLSMEEALSDEGYNCMTAVDGRDGLQKLKTQTQLPKLILLDLMMPIMDGLAFRQEQMTDPRLAKIPVVFLSADGRRLTQVKSTDNADALSKPVDLDQLFAIVKKHWV